MTDIKKKLSELLQKKYPKNVYVDIYAILKGNQHSTNDNGIFFNLNDIPGESINKCIDYIECIQYNVEDHIKNLSIRDDIENQYKSELNLPKPQTVQQKTKKPIVVQNTDQLVQKKVYKGVYKRLDRIFRGLKPEEKNKRKIVVVEEPGAIEDEPEDPEQEPVEELLEIDEVDDDEDLFGDDSDQD